jgi:hypothetical protein
LRAATARASPRRHRAGGGDDQRERGDTEEHAQDEVGGGRGRGAWVRTAGEPARVGEDLGVGVVVVATREIRRGARRRPRGNRRLDGSASFRPFASGLFGTLRRLDRLDRRDFRRVVYAPAALEFLHERLQRADEFADRGVPAAAAATAERRRLETPQKRKRGVRRTALDDDPRLLFVRGFLCGRVYRARPRGRLHLVHGSLEARRAGRRRRQPRRRRREHASLGGFLRDGVERRGREEHAGRRVERALARAFAQRDIA